jgi:hypothetical protein
MKEDLSVEAGRCCTQLPNETFRSVIRQVFLLRAKQLSATWGAIWGGNSCISRGLVIKDCSVSGPKARIREQLPPTALLRARPRCGLDHYGRRGSLNRISKEHSLATRIAANLRNDVGSGVLSPQTASKTSRLWSIGNGIAAAISFSATDLRSSVRKGHETPDFLFCRPKRKLIEMRIVDGDKANRIALHSYLLQDH